MAWNDDLDQNSPAYRFASSQSRRIRVVAGPGTGKSFALKRRVAKLLEEGGVPEKILAVTLTRIAAQDLRKEIDNLGVCGSDDVVATTLHGLCLKILGREDVIKFLGRVPRPLMDFEKRMLLHDIVPNKKVKDKEKLLSYFGAAWAKTPTEEAGFARSDIEKEFQRQMLSWMLFHRSMLFEEMVFETFRYLHDNPHSPEYDWFDHVLVDEYQDLNKAEQTIIDLLSQNSTLAVIGDDDQSIYSFRHAYPEGIRGFPNVHPNCEEIDFDHCMRCPKQVVSMASSLISHNPNRTLGDLKEHAINPNGHVEIFQYSTQEQEVKDLSEMIRDDIKNGQINPEDILILSPSRHIGREITDALNSFGVDSRSYFKESALDPKELQYNFEIFKLLIRPRDRVALRYLLGSGDATFRSVAYRKLMNKVNGDGTDIFDFLENTLPDDEKDTQIRNMILRCRNIKSELDAARDLLVEDRQNIVSILMKNAPDEKSDYFELILQEAIDEADPKLEDAAWLEELHSIIVEKLKPIENTFDKKHVRVMSLYSSKGLSAKYVVIMSAVNGLIPFIDKTKSVPEQMEEGRRLFYVAITRCKGKANGYHGKLIISTFSSMSTGYANQHGISHGSWHRTNTATSRYIQDLGETAPKVVKK